MFIGKEGIELGLVDEIGDLRHVVIDVVGIDNAVFYNKKAPILLELLDSISTYFYETIGTQGAIRIQ